MSDSKVRYVGLDVHKREAEVCILDGAGKVVERTRIVVERDYLNTFAKHSLRPGDRVVLEATTNAWAVADLLRPYVAEVVVSNPLATKAIAQAKVKTDKVDALVLAQLLRCDYLPKVWQPDEATRRLRQLTGRRSALVGQRTAIRNRIHSVLAMRLITERAEGLFSGPGLEWLGKLELDEQGRALVDADLRLHQALEAEIEALDRELARRGYSDQRIQLLMTLPDVNVAVAETLLAAWGDISRFRDAAHAVSYLGLTPKVRQSADRCHHGRITKAGNSQARWMLVQAAQCVRRHPGPLGHFFNKLARRKNHNVAVVATARKLAAIAWHMLTRNEPYRYATPLSTANKLAALRTLATGQRRKTGPKKGKVNVRKLAEGRSRTIKALATVYQEEGLPSPRELAPGELKMLHETGTVQFVASLDAERVIPKRRRPTAETRANNGVRGRKP